MKAPSSGDNRRFQPLHWINKYLHLHSDFWIKFGATHDKPVWILIASQQKLPQLLGTDR